VTGWRIDPHPLRVALVATSRYPIRQPFAGGLEALVWDLAAALRRRGHDVTLFAAEGSDGVHEELAFPPGGWDPSRLAAEDTSMPARAFMSDHHGYLRLMMALAGPLGDRFDVIHNHALHHLPVAMAPMLRTPMVTTLHTPPTPWLESAVGVTGGRGTAFTAVSDHTARQWTALGQHPRVIPNGVDTERWPLGRGGGELLWSGRLVPEKAPHLAIDAARRTGAALRIAGPMSDLPYFEQHVRPRLGRGITYLGHLEQPDLARAVGEAPAVLVTPLWDEPYGLVVAEALTCGTPVVAFARGGVPEVLSDPSLGRLVTPGDVDALAAAIPEASALDRAAIRRHAARHLSSDRMVRSYTALYRELAGPRTQAPVASRWARPRSAKAANHPSIGNQPQRA
jgi:glycosyltransferase involved in cell wall biosynthesis